MAEAVALERRELMRQALRELGLSEEEISTLLEAQKNAKRWRDKLSEVIIDFYYKTPEGKKIREALSIAAHASGWSSRMEEIMGRIAKELEQAAKETKLCTFYKLVWGKTPEGCPEYR